MRLNRRAGRHEEPRLWIEREAERTTQDVLLGIYPDTPDWIRRAAIDAFNAQFVPRPGRTNDPGAYGC
jgi:hypothetical protein